MNQGVVIRSLILLLLLHQTSTGVWYYFDDDGDDVEFKLDEVDSTYDSDYPNGDLEDKMDSHELGVTFCLWLTLFVLIVVVFEPQLVRLLVVLERLLEIEPAYFVVASPGLFLTSFSFSTLTAY